MTWLKIPEDFPEDCAKAGLSDAAVRTHLDGLVWAMRRENDGRIGHPDLRRFADTTTDPNRAVAELVAAEFWGETSEGWVIVHTMEHQPEAEVIAARRAMNAVRQRNSRRKKAGLDEEKSHRDETRDSHRDETRDDAATRRVTRSGAEQSGAEQNGTELLEDGDQYIEPHDDSARSLGVSPHSGACGWCTGEGEPGGCPDCRLDLSGSEVSPTLERQP